MTRVGAFLPAFLLFAAVASGQNYKVETYKLFEVFGNVKAFSCGGGCCEGHDSTACVGVQVLHENSSHTFDLVRTAIYDNVSCCLPQCPERQGCGIYSKDGPANSCPGNTSHFTIAIGSGSGSDGNLGLCVAPGQPFRVPWRVALLGNVVNNTPTSGSHCSAADPFVPYNNDPWGTDTWGSSAVRWGGFTDSCPNHSNPDIACVPSSCTPGDDGSAVRRYQVEIISPYGNEYVTRLDSPLVTLRWRATSRARLDTYRIVVHGPSGVWVDTMVACTTVECYHALEFPREAAAYYWWVQPLSPTQSGEQSRAGFFNLSPPVRSCNGIGGSCAVATQPGVPPVCSEGTLLLYGAFDCPDTCCGVDCQSTESHNHSGSCGSTDTCGHVFGTPADPGCGGGGQDTPSCGALGGEHCSTTFSCPAGFSSLGTTRLNGVVECLTCCNRMAGDGSCQAGVEDCGTSPADCPCATGTVCNASGSPGQCVDRCSSPAYHNHTGSCGSLDECGHAIGNPRDCLPSCGAMGGSYCSQSGSCPSSYDSLGLSSDCSPCCKPKPSCGAMGGSYCSQSGSCPSGYDSLGQSFDCSPCCKPRPQPPQPSCGAMGGDYCSQSGSCPANYSSLGNSSDCHPCCDYSPPPSCGAMGGDYCSQSASCPAGYNSLGASSDCVRCCLSEP